MSLTGGFTQAVTRASPRSLLSISVPRRGIGALHSLVLCMLCALPVQAAEVRVSSAPINGNIPTVSGDLQILFPDGATLITNGARMALSQRPGDFKVAENPDGLIYADPDGDLSDEAMPPQLQNEHSLVWKYNGTTLSETQLTESFGQNFSGKVLQVEASAPVTVTSLTGLPHTGKSWLKALYTVTVPTLTQQTLAGSNSSKYLGGRQKAFPFASRFPTTGFVGATFQVQLSNLLDDNANYHWSSSAPELVTVDSSESANAGKVTFIAAFPVSTPAITISATPRSGGESIDYSFHVKRWFVKSASPLNTWAQAPVYCSSLVGGYSVPSLAEMTDATLGSNSGFVERDKGTETSGYPQARKVGPLWSEWGDLTMYTGSGWRVNSYWVKDRSPGDLPLVSVIDSGVTSTQTDVRNNYVACVREL